MTARRQIPPPKLKLKAKAMSLLERVVLFGFVAALLVAPVVSLAMSHHH